MRSIWQYLQKRSQYAKHKKYTPRKDRKSDFSEQFFSHFCVIVGVNRFVFWPIVVLLKNQMSKWTVQLCLVCRPLGKAHAVVAVVVVVLLLEFDLMKMRDQPEDKPRVPLKTILQNFLNHVDSLESRKRARDDAYEQEFQVFWQLSKYWHKESLCWNLKALNRISSIVSPLCYLHFSIIST